MIKGLAKEMNLDGLTLTWDVLKSSPAAAGRYGGKRLTLTWDVLK